MRYAMSGEHKREHRCLDDRRLAKTTAAGTDAIIACCRGL